jgi:hypothetical protein
VLNDCLKDTFQLIPAYVNQSTMDNYFVSSIVKSDKLGVWIATCSGNGITALSTNDLSPNKELSDKFVRLELFFISVELHYSESKRVEIYRINESNGVKGYVPLLTLRGE